MNEIPRSRQTKSINAGVVSVVQLEKRHLTQICEIEQSSFSDPWSAQMVADLIENPLAVCFVAELETQNGKFVSGFLVTYHILTELQILDIAVKKEFRGQGIATKLFAEAESYAKSEDIEIMTLEVRSSNEAALALYEKIGFTSVGTRKNYYKSPVEDAVLMTLVV